MIDALGEMWTSMLLNCTASVCSVAGLLGICAQEKIVFALVILLILCKSHTSIFLSDKFIVDHAGVVLVHYISLPSLQEHVIQLMCLSCLKNSYSYSNLPRSISS